MSIVPFEEKYFPQLTEIFRIVVAKGDSFVYGDNYADADVRRVWTDSGAAFCYLADGKVAGSFVIRQNKPDRGGHVCNAGFMVKPECRGRGIATGMCAFALEEAKKMGYDAMQFNFVVSTNTQAVTLWKKMGFAIIGTVPKAYRHASAGLVDVHIMHRFL
ncbi:MAG: GNAT family N-acetyltransferase [Rickettsiales bacterium]